MVKSIYYIDMYLIFGLYVLQHLLNFPNAILMWFTLNFDSEKNKYL
jgi:hypothetical protein